MNAEFKGCAKVVPAASVIPLKSSLGNQFMRKRALVVSLDADWMVLRY